MEAYAVSADTECFGPRLIIAEAARPASARETAAIGPLIQYPIAAPPTIRADCNAIRVHLAVVQRMGFAFSW